MESKKNNSEKIIKIFEDETGKKAIEAPYCHGEIGFASWDYQLWLEEKISNFDKKLAEVYKEGIEEGKHFGWADYVFSDEFSKQTKRKFLESYIAGCEHESHWSIKWENLPWIGKYRRMKKFLKYYHKERK